MLRAGLPVIEHGQGWPCYEKKTLALRIESARAVRGAQCASKDFLRRGVRAERAPAVRSRCGVRALVFVQDARSLGFVQGVRARWKVRMLRLRCARCEEESNVEAR